MKVYPALTLFAHLVAAAPIATAADIGEEVFKNALRYTVQVRTMLPIPFDGDRKGSGLGAGFVVDAERGWVMTNAHVVGRSPSRVEVALHGQEFSEATKIYVDPYLDLAIIRVSERVSTKGIAVPRLECARVPPVGHPVGAFGHPWRLQYTGTRGIISGVTARFRTELLQTDAPINQGNSGGPLISLESGGIVGINTAGIRGAQNTNFAVAIKYACRILQLLQKGEDPSPPDLRLVYFRDIDNRKQLKVARSYASDGTLKLVPGDVIRQVVGEEGVIENETQLLHALRGRLANSSLKVLRGGEETVVSGHKLPMRRVLETRGVYASGVLFGPITIRDWPEIGPQGLMVHHVESGSIGESQDVVKSDLLEAVDGSAVLTIDDLYSRLGEARKDGRRVTLTFKRVAGSDAMFSYTQRNLPIGDLRIIGPQTAEQ